MFKDVLVSQNLDVSNFLVQKGLNAANQFILEVVTNRCSVKKVFLEMPQNSQEIT